MQHLALYLTLFQDPNDLATYYQPVHAHAGFLNSAEALTPTLSKHIEDAIRKRSIKHVLFTGHSAGGAVASLLLAKYLTRAAEDC
jgi:pimeloyl-ACP methyl ester carboxylesterase